MNHFLAMPAEKLFERKKLQTVCDICDVCCCMSHLKHKCLWRGRFVPIWGIVTHGFVFVWSLLCDICNNLLLHEPQLSHRMNFVLGQVSHSYGWNVSAGKYLCSSYQCFHQPCDHDFWEELVRLVWCCLLYPGVSCFECKWESQTTLPIFCIASLHIGIRHCIVGWF